MEPSEVLEYSISFSTSRILVTQPILGHLRYPGDMGFVRQDQKQTIQSYSEVQTALELQLVYLSYH